MVENANHQFVDISKIQQENNLCTSLENLPLEDMPNIVNDIHLAAEQKDVRDALNCQTIIQYRQYAMEQFPKEFTKQDELITQLQEQHFKTYWDDVHLAMLCHQQEQFEKKSAIFAERHENSETNIRDDDRNEQIERFPVVPAQLWTMKDIVEFKADILKNSRSHCIKVSSLSTATIKIPTYQDGHRLFWKFATDFYDIGFGLYFEWNMNPSDKIEVSISESSEDEENEENESNNRQNDEEIASARKDSIKSVNRDPNRPPIDELITVYRRESHMEVYCGSHEYPGLGYYILKFDNTYSVWRSKWVYYHIYYTK